jgi:selenide,water dikinase
VHAATDVTGFGLAGHGLGMARGSGVTLRVSVGRLPLYDDALALQQAGVKTKGTATNQACYQPSVRVGEGVPADRGAIVYDPQTAGGLLIALDGDRAARTVEKLHAAGVAFATIIGDVVAAEGEPALELRP